MNDWNDRSGAPPRALDETGDGKVDALDLKAQLNRLEQQLEQQDEQNRKLLHRQKALMWAAAIALAALFAVILVMMLRFNTAYRDVMAACGQVNTLAATLQSSLATLDADELNTMMQNLPDIADKLSKVDVDALNEVMQKLPETMQTIADLQDQVETLTTFFNNLGGLFG